MLREHYLGCNEQDKSIIQPLVIPVGVKVTPEIKRRLPEYVSTREWEKQKKGRGEEVKP